VNQLTQEQRVAVLRAADVKAFLQQGAAAGVLEDSKMEEILIIDMEPSPVKPAPTNKRRRAQVETPQEEAPSV